MSEDKHRRWNWMNATAHWAQEEHNALYDAYEAERKRADAAEKEVAEHRRHVSIQMSREAEARRALRAAEQRVRELEAENERFEHESFATDVVDELKAEIERLKKIEAGTNGLVGQHMRDEIAWKSQRDNLHKRVQELELAQRATSPEVPPGVPSVEELAKVAFKEFHKGEFAWSASAWRSDWIRAAAAVRDAILAALPVLTREEVEALFDTTFAIGADSFAGLSGEIIDFRDAILSRLPARLERVAVTGSEIADAIRGKQVIPATKAVMTLLHEKQLVREPEPECFDVTEEDIAEVLDDQLSMVIDMDLCKAGAAAVMSLLREKQLVQEPEPIATAETLEQLAEIAANEYWKTEEDWKADDWEDELRRDWVGVITAILRAARPEINTTHEQLVGARYQYHPAGNKEKSNGLRGWLNSRIRYRVELPPDEWKAAVDDALVVCDMTADSFGSPREAVQALLCWHAKTDGWLASDNLRQRQIECYERVREATLAVLSGVDSDCNVRELCYDAHQYGIEAARTLPARLAELTAKLDEKGGD